MIFEVGKKYKTKSGTVIFKSVFVGNSLVVLVNEETGYELTAYGGTTYWEEYKEPKKNVQEWYLSSYNTGFGVHKNLLNMNKDFLVGKIRITYTEGQGLEVEVLEGGITQNR